MRRALILALLVPLAGCAASTGKPYPSLLPRPQEGFDFAEPSRPPAAAAPDPALDAQLTTQRQQLEAATRQFDEAAAKAEALASAATGSPAGSDPWIAAQVALSELDVQRGDIAAIATELERFAVDRAASGKPAYPPLDELLTQARQADAAQRDRIARMERALVPA